MKRKNIHPYDMRGIVLLLVLFVHLGTFVETPQKRYAEAVAKSFINRFPDPDVIRWGNDRNHFTWQAGYIMFAMEKQPVIDRAYRGLVRKTIRNDDGNCNLIDCSCIGIKDNYEEYLAQPHEISTYAAFGSFILGTGVVEHGGNSR